MRQRLKTDIKFLNKVWKKVNKEVFENEQTSPATEIGDLCHSKKEKLICERELLKKHRRAVGGSFWWTVFLLSPFIIVWAVANLNLYFQWWG